MVLGNIGVPVGTEFVVPAAGALAGSGHLSSWWLVGLVATAGEIVGGLVLYTIGYYGGRPFVARWGKYIKLSEEKLDAFHGFYERHGSVVVFVCRFIPVIRGVSALPAGVSRMQKRYFILYTAAGSACFCFGLAWLGNAFGKHLGTIMPQIHRFSLIFIGFAAATIIGVVAFQIVRSRRGSDAA
jgi:membrane protein DedA with SNARE-associated domain